MKTKKLNIDKVMEQFQKAENSMVHRKDAFKIAAPFDKALDTILKSQHHAKTKLARKK